MNSAKLYSIALVFITFSMEVKGQDISNTFILPSYSIDGSVLAYHDEDNDDLFIGGFHQLGIEGGKQFGKRKIGLNFKYGINPFYDRYFIEFIASYKTYWGVALNYRSQITPKDLNSDRFRKFGYRLSLVFHQYDGTKVVRNMQGNFEIVDATENVYGVESGFYFDLGKKDKLSVNIEPLYVRITNNFFGIGVLRTGVEFRF